jgi:hypothetical protein
MISNFPPLLASYTGSELLAMLIVAGAIITLAGIVASVCGSIYKIRVETALKQQMVERGMPVDDMVRVLHTPASDPCKVGAGYPCASEAVVERDGEWSAALILKRDADRYFVHFVGQDMSENEWVSSDRLRFPASQVPSNSPWEWMGGAGLDPGQWCSNHAKPARTDAEL